jgi:hypothetical protein
MGRRYALPFLKQGRASNLLRRERGRFRVLGTDRLRSPGLRRRVIVQWFPCQFRWTAPRQPVLSYPVLELVRRFRTLRRIHLLAVGSSRIPHQRREGWRCAPRPVRSNYSSEAGRCRNRGRHWHHRLYQFERGDRGPRTTGEIDGATQFSDLSARCGQFQALAFPRFEPCRSRCPALAGLVRARTSDDILPRAPCTPPPKSLPPSSRPCHPARMPRASRMASVVSSPGYSDLCATGSCGRCGHVMA